MHVSVCVQTIYFNMERGHPFTVPVLYNYDKATFIIIIIVIF